MKATIFVSLLSLACSAVVVAEAQDAGKQLQIYPKNLARQHIGANLFLFDKATQTFLPTEAAAAWLDDDITSGWPILAGKQYYMLALPQPELLTNFQLSAQAANGSISLYASDEVAVPGSKAWAPLVKGVPVAQVNETKLKKPFSRVAKYLLIETDIADPVPVFSLYAYTDKPAVAYELSKREQSIDSRAIFGPYVSEQTAFNVTGLYAQSYVAYADSSTGFVAWQKVIDDNPESGVLLAPSTEQSTMIIRAGAPQPISRIAAQVKAGTAGKMSLYISKKDAPTASDTGVAPGAAVSLAERVPTVVLDIDGSTDRTSLEFPEIEASEIVVKWEPANGIDPLEVLELNAFGPANLANYAVAMRPDAIAELNADRRADRSKDGKTFADGKTGKELLEPIAEGPDAIAAPPQAGPYLPGSLGFPPNIAGFGVIPPMLPPDKIVSP